MQEGIKYMSAIPTKKWKEKKNFKSSYKVIPASDGLNQE